MTTVTAEAVMLLPEIPSIQRRIAFIPNNSTKGHLYIKSTFTPGV
ncbi:hypothetical protein SAMN05428949_7090 [Chitinophaga sp. YR627]|nr:hypothetical protein [Chitinophaga sp. YR627]SFO99146.1 hypothetical protein SAMN05428949_7090 [Chitinophaga sp. YR627]